MATAGLTKILFLAMVLIVSTLCNGAMGQPGCNSALTSMASCLNYVTGNATSPSSVCCSQFANVVQASPQCLCSILNGRGPSIGIAINQTLALSLPGACNVQTPPINQCKAATAPSPSAFSPVSSPATSPANSAGHSISETPKPATTPAATSTPSASGSGSKTSTTGTSGGSILKASPKLLAFVLFISAVCGSTMTKL